MPVLAKTTPLSILAIALVALAGQFVPLRAFGLDDCYRDINDRTSCDTYQEQWKETNVVIPAVPKDSDFTILAVTEADERYHYYLARNSITRGQDGVMRYTVAVVSGSGVRNIFYEGLRCATDESKTYAYATERGAFRRSLKSRWHPLANKGIRAYQEFLSKVIVCDPNGYAWDAQKARHALLSQFTPGGFRRGATCRTCDSDGFIRND